jgi:hypothetical protein
MFLAQFVKAELKTVIDETAIRNDSMVQVIRICMNFMLPPDG